MLIHLRHRRITWSILAVVVTCGATAALLKGRPWEASRKGSKPVAVDGSIPAKVIRPRRDPSFVIAIQQIASVEAYFQANLRARASGLVRFVQKDIGDAVRKGELLVEIDEPDLVQDVAQKEAVIAQRQFDVQMAEAMVRHADAQLDVAKATIDQRQAEVEKEKTTCDTRKKKLERYKYFKGRDVVVESNLEEVEGDYLASVAAVTGAEMAVKKAQADFREKQASVETARAEVRLKESLVDVAGRDRDRAQAMLDYARVLAPFDGFITQRNVDPGAFVQNATTSNTEALMSVARTDIVTVAFQLPDYAAAFVGRGTAVVIQLDELPGVVIRGHVSRYTPSIRGTDRTMRVEVDLFNGSEDEYRKFLAKGIAAAIAPAAGADVGAATLAAAAQHVWSPNQKGATDPLPLRPVVLTAAGSGRRMLPGMGGSARVELQEFDNVYLLPSSAIFSRGGKPYLLEIKDGKSHLVPVKVQVNDGRLAKVAIITQPAGAKLGDRDVLKELTGDEQIIASRQLEIGDGQAVRATPADW